MKREPGFGLGFSASCFGSALSAAWLAAGDSSASDAAAAVDAIGAIVGRDLPRRLKVGRGRAVRCVVVLWPAATLSAFSSVAFSAAVVLLLLTLDGRTLNRFRAVFCMFGNEEIIKR